jgi:hypothetical protein
MRRERRKISAKRSKPTLETRTQTKLVAKTQRKTATKKPMTDNRLPVTMKASRKDKINWTKRRNERRERRTKVLKQHRNKLSQVPSKMQIPKTTKGSSIT